jgi:hypothetical protein
MTTNIPHIIISTMAIQGEQNISGITFNKGTTSITTVVRLGTQDAFGEIVGTGWQAGDGYVPVVNNYYDNTVTSNTYNISGATLSGGYLNIESFGAVANAESTTAIQNCINAAFASGFGVFVPGKAYRISSTINFPYQMGGRIQGLGNSVGTIDGQVHPLFGPSSRLVWHGGPHQPMVCISGQGLTWDSVSLIGSPTRTVMGTGVVGILLAHGAVAGLGTTKAQFESINIMNCEIGVSLAASGEIFAGNNDHCLWSDVYMTDCSTGFLISSEQAIGHHVQKFEFGLAWTTPRKHSAVVGKHGGTFYCDDILVTQPNVRILELIGAGPGENNDNYTFKNVKCDNNALSAKLLDMTSWQPSGIYTETAAVIKFEDVKLSYNSYTSQSETWLVDAYGGIKLILENCDKIQRQALKLRGKPTQFPNVTVSNTRPWITIGSLAEITGLIHPSSSGTYYWRTHNVSNWSGVPIRDTGNYLL